MMVMRLTSILLLVMFFMSNALASTCGSNCQSQALLKISKTKPSCHQEQKKESESCPECARHKSCSEPVLNDYSLPQSAIGVIQIIQPALVAVVLWNELSFKYKPKSFQKYIGGPPLSAYKVPLYIRNQSYLI